MTQHGMSGRSAERKPSPLFELACVLVRFDHVCAGGLRKHVSKPSSLANVTLHRLTVSFANGHSLTPVRKLELHSIRKFNSN